MSEARREDDSSSKHGETREKSHHGRRLCKKVMRSKYLFVPKSCWLYYFKCFQNISIQKVLETIFCVKDLLTFDLAQPTHPNTEERENADLGEGRGFKDITRFAKAVNNINFQIFLSFQKYQRRKEVSNIA